MNNSVRAIEANRVIEPKRHHLLASLIIRLIKEKRLGAIGGLIVLLMLLTGIFADFIAPYGYNEIHLGHALRPPSAQYLLGTDNLGRDQLSRIIYGARISMVVGVAAAALNVLIAIIIGLPSGFFGGRTDMTIQRVVDAWMCFPWLFIVLSIIVLLGPGLVQVIIVLGITSGIRDSRIIRSAVVGIKGNLYIEAAKAIGCSTMKTLNQHILPNVTAPIIIIFTLSMGASILAEATMSFLGFGVPPPNPSWGGMLSTEGRQYMLVGPWLAIWPGIILSIAVYGINMLGDAIRDILDPRLRGGVGQYGIKYKGNNS